MDEAFDVFVVHRPNQSPACVCRDLVTATMMAQDVIGDCESTLETRIAGQLYYLTDTSDSSNCSRIEAVPSKK